jgi:hypothetical protein
MISHGDGAVLFAWTTIGLVKAERVEKNAERNVVLSQKQIKMNVE